MKSILNSIFGGSKDPKTITGCIVDATSKEPLIGVTVYAGDGYETFTDLDGNFALTMPAKVKLIKCSFPGYENKFVKCNAGRLDIALDLK